MHQIVQHYYFKSWPLRVRRHGRSPLNKITTGCPNRFEPTAPRTPKAWDRGCPGQGILWWLWIWLAHIWDGVSNPRPLRVWDLTYDHKPFSRLWSWLRCRWATEENLQIMSPTTVDISRGIPWYTMVYHGNTMVYHGIPWYTMVYHGIPWYTMVYHGIPWYTMVYHGIPWYTMVYHGIPWYTMVYHGIPLYTTVYHGIPRYTMVYRGIPWYTMADHLLVYGRCWDATRRLIEISRDLSYDRRLLMGIILGVQSGRSMVVIEIGGQIKREFRNVYGRRGDKELSGTVGDGDGV